MMMADAMDSFHQFDSEIRRPLSFVSLAGSDGSLDGLMEEKAKLGEILLIRRTARSGCSNRIELVSNASLLFLPAQIIS
jgi:hypothetical protein